MGADLKGVRWRRVASPGHVNIYALFVALALRWAKPSGLVGLIIPASFIGGPFYDRLRSHIRRWSEVIALGMVDERDDLFLDVAQDVCLLLLRKSEGGHRPDAEVQFGAIDFARAMCRVGKLLGFHVTVCDARPVFATERRFPEADEVVVDWPHRWLAAQEVDSRTVICVLTHDTKFDVPAITTALRTPAAYVGALGSRRTHERRIQALRDAGLTDEELSRLHSPIGLDLGARTPEETAISIAAEIVQNRWGGSGRPLAHGEGPIHAEPVG